MCTLTAQAGKYQVILVDPPWSFRVWSKDTGHGRSAESHYDTMSLENMKQLQIGKLAHSNCALFMWVTMPTLRESFELADAWGFEYRTCAFTWAKRTSTNQHWHMGMGYYTRANAELCLLFIRGKMKRKSASVRQLIVSPIGIHSQKPVEQYERIEQLFDGPYIELFARNTHEGWDSLGNSLDNMDIREILDNL